MRQAIILRSPLSAENYCFASGFGAVAVVTFVFQRVPAHTFAGFCIRCLLHLHGFCICWFLRSKSDAFAKFCTELLLFFAIDGCRICYFLHGLLIFFRDSSHLLAELSVCLCFTLAAPQCGEPRIWCEHLCFATFLDLLVRPRLPAEIAAKMAEKMTVADIAKVFQARAFVCGFRYAR